VGLNQCFRILILMEFQHEYFVALAAQRNWKNISMTNAALGRAMAAERGWTGAQWDALLELFACESSWIETAGNPYSGAYGIPQSLPAGKMASHGSDYMVNPKTQIAWGLDYIAGRYGNPVAAMNFHHSTNWY
jgi:resuscitation-promoting factor RpfB